MAKIYRGIVVVHGVGEHKKGSYVSGFVEQLASYLNHLPGYEGRVELTARNRSDSADTSWATIHIDNANPAGADEEWHIREAWWTRTFQPSQPGRIYLWAVLAGLALLWSACVQQLARGLLAFTSKERLARWATERVGRPIDRTTHEHLDEAGQGVWRQPEAGTLKSILDGVVWVVLTGLFIVVGAVGLLAIGVVYLVLVLPLSFVFPALANKIVNALVKAIVFSLGDQEAMTTRQVALAAAANEVNAGLWNMLSEPALRARHRDEPAFSGFETVSVVAHSGGCVVSLAALKSSDLKEIRSQPLTGGLTRPDRLNWITAGSGLNLAWNVKFGNSPSNLALWRRPLDRVNWLNLYARYDPVPQGPPPADMVEALVGADPERVQQPPAAAPVATPRPPFVGIRIANTDSPWADHGGYWSNHPEVMSRVVHVVTNPGLAGVSITPDPVTPAPPGKNLQGLDAAIAGGVADEIPRRRWRVTRSMVTLVVGLGVFAFIAAKWGDDVGQWALGTGKFLGMDPWRPGGHQLENVVTKKLASGKAEGYRDRLIGIVVIGFVTMIALEYVKLFRWLVAFASTRDNRRRKVLWFAASATILLATLAILDLLLVRWPTGQLG